MEIWTLSTVPCTSMTTKLSERSGIPSSSPAAAKASSHVVLLSLLPLPLHSPFTMAVPLSDLRISHSGEARKHLISTQTRKEWVSSSRIVVGDYLAERKGRSCLYLNNASGQWRGSTPLQMQRCSLDQLKLVGEGISLVGASRIIILDVHVNPLVSRQALGRAFRPDQQKKVYTYRLVAADSPEEEDHAACYKKELIAKRWFEWNDHDVGKHNSRLEEVDLKDSGDIFLESAALNEDVKLLQKR